MSYTSTPPTVQQKSHMPVNPKPNSPCWGSNEATSRRTIQFLNILFWNAGGLNPAKFSELKSFIHDHDTDIFVIVEAGAATDNIQPYQLTGFTIHTVGRGRQVASGIIIGTVNDIASNIKILHEMEAEDKLEAVQIDAWLNENHFRVVAAYNPPMNTFDHLILEQAITDKTIVIGDFNAQSTRWGYSRTSAVGGIMESLIDSSSLILIETEPTFLSFAGQLSRPDLILPHASLSDRCQHQLFDDPSGCGHRIVSVAVAPKLRVPKRKPLTRWNFKKARWGEYAAKTDILMTPDLIAGNPDLTFRNITEAILRAASAHIPRGQVEKYSPFWTRRLTDLKAKRNGARRTAERTQKLEDCVLLRKAQASLQREIIQSKRDTFHNFVAGMDYRRDGTKAHRFISRLNNVDQPHKVTPIINGTEIITSKKGIANHFCKHFSVCTGNFPHRRKKPGLRGPLPELDSQLFNNDFSLSELKQAINVLKTGKSCGPDDIFPEFVSHLGKRALSVLLLAINQTWHLGIPDMWRKAEIIPILKKGKDSSMARNYRPISLTSILCKVVERMVNNRLQVFLDRYCVIACEQAGFRRHRSTTDQVIKLTQFIKDGFHRKMSTLACFIDFQGAYDTVSRKILFNKLIDINISGNMLRWLGSFLSQRFIRVRYGDVTSRYRQQRRGLPQGAVLSCVLFNIMINDLIGEIKKEPGVEVLCYADDLTVWSTSSKISGMERSTNEALCRLQTWCGRNDMIVNKEKTTAQLFTLSTKKYTINLTYEQSPVELLQSTKYLGMTLDKRLGWSQHVESAADRATKRLCILRRLTGTKWGATQDVLACTYKTYVRPVMEYGCEAFATTSDTNKKRLTVVQNNALRLVCGAAVSTPITALESQTQTEPLEARRDGALLRFFERSHRVGDKFWERYRTANGRLKTQTTPLTRALELQQKYQINTGERLLFRRPEPPRDGPDLPVCLLLPGIEDRKADVSPHLLKAAALEMLASDYPQTEWTHVYTDGSAIGDKCGAGFYTTFLQGSVPVGRLGTNFDGEVAAIGEAAERLLALPRLGNIVVLSDSTAALQAISSPSLQENEIVSQCQKRLLRLQERADVRLQWIPGHCDIYGNDRADQLAKAGCLLPQED